MRVFCSHFWKDTQGQDLVEYALMAGMVALAAVAGVPALGGPLSAVFSKVASIVAAASPG